MLARDGVSTREVARDVVAALTHRVVYTGLARFRRLFEAAGVQMRFRIGHAGFVIPDVAGRSAAIEADARQRAGPPHRAVRADQRAV